MMSLEIKELVRKKRFLIESFFYSISLKPEASTDNVLRHAVTGHFLKAIVLELIIKALFELDHKEVVPFTHNLANIFKDLNVETKVQLSSLYNKARKRHEHHFASVKIKDVVFHPLNKALSNNELTIKNFKYDAMGTNSNASIDSAFIKDVFEFIDVKIIQLDV
jgi:hypothetical protein